MRSYLPCWIPVKVVELIGMLNQLIIYLLETVGMAVFENKRININKVIRHLFLLKIYSTVECKKSRMHFTDMTDAEIVPI